MAASPTTYAPSVTLAWLVRLRWGSVVAQAVTVLVGVLGLGAASSALACGVVGVTAATNVALFAVARRGRPVHAWLVGSVLVFDTAALTALLFLCGGPSNPFSTLYLVYVTLAALALGIEWASVVVAVSAAGYALLFLAGNRMGMAHMHHDGSAFSAHLQAMWVAFTVTAALIAYFVARVARALREREEQLAEARDLAVRVEKLASLSTLAAGAAHELGTPLGTIAVVSRELERTLRRTPGFLPLCEDARLIRDEVDRCRQIVQQMSGRSGEAMGEVPVSVALDQVLEEVRRPNGASPPGELLVDVDAELPPRVVLPVRGLVQSLRNILRNAWDAGGPADPVHLRVRLAEGYVSFEVEDRGAGMPREVLGRVGEPFFTTKPPGKGTGLGIFLARTFAERWRGRLTLHSDAGRGTRAVLELPLNADGPADVS